MTSLHSGRKRCRSNSRSRPDESGKAWCEAFWRHTAKQSCDANSKVDTRGMNGTGAGDRQFIREATRPKLPSGLLSHPELPENPFGTPPSSFSRSIARNWLPRRYDSGPSLKTRQRPPAVATLPGWSCGVATSREGHRSPKLARAPWGRIGILFDGT
jgi:hypothetical protein